MTKPEFDQDFWEQLWSKALREHGEKVARHVATSRRTRTYLRGDFFASGFQFVSNVIGVVALLSSTVLIRKRPSGATSYCRPWALSTPPSANGPLGGLGPGEACDPLPVRARPVASGVMQAAAQE